RLGGTPVRDVTRKLGRCDAGHECACNVSRGQGPARALQKSHSNDPDRDDTTSHEELLAYVQRFLIPSERPRAKLEALEQRQRFPESNRLGRDHGVPAATPERL